MNLTRQKLKLLITESLKIQLSNSVSEEDKELMMQGLFQMFNIDEESLQEKNKVDYKKAYKKYHSSKKAKKERAQRNAAGRMLKKAGVKIPPGHEIDHKKAISDGGTNDLSNLRVISKEKNRKLGQKITTKKRKSSGDY